MPGEMSEARRLEWLERVASAAANLLRYYEKSVNVGPFSNNPSRETLFWRALRSALEEGGATSDSAALRTRAPAPGSPT